MKQLDKYNFFKLIPAINIVLSFSAVVLVFVILFNMKRQYYPDFAGSKTLISGQIGIIGTENAKIVPAIPAFNEDIFKRKKLFNFSKRKSKEPEKREFILLGASVGEKNIAMIKDTRENKDYYCREGDKIGGFIIKQIVKDKVILESEGNILIISQ